jgi:hypothetical protein
MKIIGNKYSISDVINQMAQLYYLGTKLLSDDNLQNLILLINKYNIDKEMYDTHIKTILPTLKSDDKEASLKFLELLKKISNMHHDIVVDQVKYKAVQDIIELYIESLIKRENIDNKKIKALLLYCLHVETAITELIGISSESLEVYDLIITHDITGDKIHSKLNNILSNKISNNSHKSLTTLSTHVETLQNELNNDSSNDMQQIVDKYYLNITRETKMILIQENMNKPKGTTVTPDNKPIQSIPQAPAGDAIRQQILANQAARGANGGNGTLIPEEKRKILQLEKGIQTIMTNINQNKDLSEEERKIMQQEVHERNMELQKQKKAAKEAQQNQINDKLQKNHAETMEGIKKQKEKKKRIEEMERKRQETLRNNLLGSKPLSSDGDN